MNKVESTAYFVSDDLYFIVNKDKDIKMVDHVVSRSLSFDEVLSLKEIFDEIVHAAKD